VSPQINTTDIYLRLTQTIDIIRRIVYTKNTINIFLCNKILKGCDFMPDYEKLYHETFNAVTDAERLLGQAIKILRVAQLECEESYIESDEPPNESPSDNKIASRLTKKHTAELT